MPIYMRLVTAAGNDTIIVGRYGRKNGNDPKPNFFRLNEDHTRMNCGE